MLFGAFRPPNPENRILRSVRTRWSRIHLFMRCNHLLSPFLCEVFKLKIDRANEGCPLRRLLQGTNAPLLLWPPPLGYFTDPWIPGEDQFARTQRRRLEIGCIGRKDLPASVVPQQLDRSHVGKLAAQTLVVLPGGGEPHSVVFYMFCFSRSMRTIFSPT
jgi:hypothetical protein